MNIPSTAVPGQWHVDRSSGDMLQVVGVDDDGASIDIQYVDGTLEETSRDEWLTLDLEACDQPEDWVGPFDDLEPDDVGLPEGVVEIHGAEQPIERALLDLEARRFEELGVRER
jgi:hypothetical protein